MRKINKILSGVTAATIAFGSLAAYVAYAADFTVTGVAKASTAPATMTDGKDNTLEQYAANMAGVEIDGSAGNYTVTLDKSKMTAYTSKGGEHAWFALAVTLDQEYDVTALSAINGINEEDVTDGYAFAGASEPSDKSKSQHIVLWISGDTERTITIAGLGLSIKIEFKADAEDVDVTVTNSIVLGGVELEGGETLADIVTVSPLSATVKAGETVDVTVTVAEGYEIVVTGTVEEDTSEDDPKEDDPKEDDPKEDDPKEDDPKEEDPKEDDPKEDDPKEDDPKEDNPTTTPDKTLDGEAAVTPGTVTVVETGAGNVTVTTDKDDTALTDTKFVVETVEEASKDLTAAVGAAATEATKKAVEEAVKAVEDGSAVILDLSFVRDGVTVQPDKAVEVTLPVPEALKEAAKVYIYHVGEDGITHVASPDVKDGKITFSASKFSPFIISKVEIKNAASASDKDNTPGTKPDDTDTDGKGDSNPNTGIALAVAPVLLAAGVVVVAAKKRR